jgi:hypothetical protein
MSVARSGVISTCSRESAGFPLRRDSPRTQARSRKTTGFTDPNVRGGSAATGRRSSGLVSEGTSAASAPAPISAGSRARRGSRGSKLISDFGYRIRDFDYESDEELKKLDLALAGFGGGRTFHF